MKNSALVVIDLQNDITKNYKEIIENVNKAIVWAVQKELWVIYIQHNNLSAGTRTFKPGTHGAELVPELNVVSEHIQKQVNFEFRQCGTHFIKDGRQYKLQTRDLCRQARLAGINYNCELQQNVSEYYTKKLL